MKLKVFDVIELKNGDRATILDINNNVYKVEVVDKNGISKGIKNIEETDVKDIIISKIF